jgi:hypothetical protein
MSEPETVTQFEYTAEDAVHGSAKFYSESGVLLFAWKSCTFEAAQHVSRKIRQAEQWARDDERIRIRRRIIDAIGDMPLD